MADLTGYINGFFGLGSKATVKANQKDLLIRLLSYEAQSLTAPQKIQVLSNLGISIEDFGKHGRVSLAKGTHDVAFDVAFSDDYGVVPYGSNGSASFLPIITDVSHLDYFTVKMPVDGFLTWDANLLTQ